MIPALAITNPEGTDLNGTLHMVLDHVAHWSTSTIPKKPIFVDNFTTYS
jgi:hypothetical protein